MREIADRHRCSPGQVALAWIISTWPYACPITGTSKVERATENSHAADVHLTDADSQELNQTSTPFQVDPIRYRGPCRRWSTPNRDHRVRFSQTGGRASL